jgi:hypothetical protein
MARKTLWEWQVVRALVHCPVAQRLLWYVVGVVLAAAQRGEDPRSLGVELDWLVPKDGCEFRVTPDELTLLLAMSGHCVKPWEHLVVLQLLRAIRAIGFVEKTHHAQVLEDDPPALLDV